MTVEGGSELVTLLLMSPCEDGGVGSGDVVGGGGVCEEGVEVMDGACVGGVSWVAVRCPPFSVTALASCSLRAMTSQ